MHSKNHSNESQTLTRRELIQIGMGAGSALLLDLFPNQAIAAHVPPAGYSGILQTYANHHHVFHLTCEDILNAKGELVVLSGPPIGDPVREKDGTVRSYPFDPIQVRLQDAMSIGHHIHARKLFLESKETLTQNEAYELRGLYGLFNTLTGKASDKLNQSELLQRLADNKLMDKIQSAGFNILTGGHQHAVLLSKSMVDQLRAPIEKWKDQVTLGKKIENITIEDQRSPQGVISGPATIGLSFNGYGHIPKIASAGDLYYCSYDNEQTDLAGRLPASMKEASKFLKGNGQGGYSGRTRSQASSARQGRS